MIHVPEPRLSEHLLASIFEARIILIAIVSLVPCIENHYYPLMHDPAVWWWNRVRIQ
jgi:hypothetical protein